MAAWCGAAPAPLPSSCRAAPRTPSPSRKARWSPGSAAWPSRPASADDSVINRGTLNGSVDLGGGTNGLVNEAGATFNSGTVVKTAGDTSTFAATFGAGPGAPGFINHGTVNPGGLGVIATTSIAGGLGSDGVLQVDVDSASARNDQIRVVGGATLSGTIDPRATSIAPKDSYTIFVADQLTSTAVAKDSGLAYSWAVHADDTSLTISPIAHFLPKGVWLSGNEASVGGSLQRVWDTGDVGGMSKVFNGLIDINSVLAYQSALGQPLPATAPGPGGAAHRREPGLPRPHAELPRVRGIEHPAAGG